MSNKIESYTDQIARLFPVPREKIKDEKTKIMPRTVTWQVVDSCNLCCTYCVTGDSLVTMANYEKKPIKDIKIGDSVLGFTETPEKRHHTQVFPAEVLHTFKRTAAVYEVTLENGHKLNITGNHKVLVRRNSAENHKYDFRAIEDLTPGRSIYVLPIAELPDILEPEENEQYQIGYLTGMLKGDGSNKSYITKEGYNTYKFRLAVVDDEIIQRTKKYLDNFNFDTYLKPYEVSVNKNLIKDAIFSDKESTYSKLNEMFENNLGKNDSIDYLKGFLAGIYDAEGHISPDDRTVRITNTNEQIILEIERALEAIGIPFIRELHGSTKNKEYKWNIRITDNKNALNSFKFLRLIKSALPRKNYEKFWYYSPLERRKITSINKLNEEVEVYNIETTSGTYIVNGFAVHNCYQIAKQEHVMSWEVAKQFCDLLLDSTEENNEYINPEISNGLIMEFIGGEPFLAIELIDKICDYMIDQMITRQHPWATRFMISICSNGVLYFDPRVQAFMEKHKHHLSFSISIDGCKELHDACRVFPDGSGSYDIAMAGVEHFREHFKGKMGSKMTLAPGNIDYTFKAVKSLIENGYDEINLNCVYEKGWTTEHAKILYDELCKVADYIIENDLFHKVELSIFNDRFFQPKEETDLDNWCGGLGSMLSCDWKGDLYPCIRYMESSLGDDCEPLKVGHVSRGLVKTDEEKELMRCMNCVTRRSQSTDECFYCPIAEGCSWCFPAGTKVLTPNGHRNIEDLKIGDKVIDANGEVQIVENNLIRQVTKDELTSIKASGMLETIVTKEHPYLVKKVEKRHNNKPIYGEPKWVEAKDVKLSDKIALFIPKCGNKDVDKAMAYLVGRYIGDGWKTASNRETHPFRYYLCGSFDEQQEIEKYFDLANIKVTKSLNKTVAEYNINITSNEYFISLLDDCGPNAKGKHIPREIMSWNKDSIEALLKGYLDADGCYDKKNKTQRFTSVSYQLILDIAELVRMVYHKNVNITIRNPKPTTVIEGRTVNQSTSYEGRYKTTEPQRKYYEYDEENNIMWINVATSELDLPEELIVYNLTVANSHTFIANGAIVHNCSAYNYQDTGSFDKRSTHICIMHKARALANAYFYNMAYLQYNEPKAVKMWIPDEWALEIIDEEELNKLHTIEAMAMDGSRLN